LVKPKKELKPEERARKPRKRAGHRGNVKTKLDDVADAQERAEALAYTAKVKARSNIESMAAQVALLVSGQVLAIAQAMSYDLSAYNPPRSSSHASGASWLSRDERKPREKEEVVKKEA
jgi:hypothetical protein